MTYDELDTNPARKPDWLALLRDLSDSEHSLERRTLRAFSHLEPNELRRGWPLWRELPAERRSDVASALFTLAEDSIDLDFRPFFLACLDDPLDAVRATAVSGLWEDDSVLTMRRLLPLVDDPSSPVRVAALLNLARFAYQAEMGELSDDAAQHVCTTLLDVAADHAQPLNVRRRAVEALGYLASSPQAQVEVSRAYAHNDQLMRESALVAMGRSMRPEWFPIIERELSSLSPALRYEAARAVGELAEEGQPLLPKLLPLADETDTEIALAAIWALGEVGGERAERALRRLSKEGNEMRREAAQEALADLLLEDL